MLGKQIVDKCSQCDCGEERLIVNKRHYLCNEKNQERLLNNSGGVRKQQKQLLAKSMLKPGKRRLGLSKKNIDKNKLYKQVCNQIAEDRIHVCTGCMSASNLTHSHIISRSRRPDLVTKSWNITYHCISCHENWESRNIIKMMKLNDFTANIAMIKNEEGEWNSLLLNKMSKLGPVIYQINNHKNGKFYIGSTENLRKRFLRHIKELNKNIHHSSKLQNQVNKYGIDCIQIDIIEQVSEKDLREREQFWIDEKNPPLNIMLTVAPCRKIKFPTKINRVDRAVSCYNDKGMRVKTFNRIQDAIKWIGSGYVTAISEACSGKRISAYKYFWRYGDLDMMIFRKRETKSKVVQLNIDGVSMIKIWENMTTASKKLNIQLGDICGCTKKRLKSAGGFYWMKYNEYLELKLMKQ